MQIKNIIAAVNIHVLKTVLSACAGVLCSPFENENDLLKYPDNIHADVNNTNDMPVR